MNENTYKLIYQHGADKILTQLQAYVSPRRQQRIIEILNNRLQSIQIALEMPADIHNAYAVIRSSEIFGLTKVHIITPEKNLASTSIRPISKGAMDWVEIIYYQNIEQFLQAMQAQNIRLAGASLRAEHNLNSIPLEGPVCLVLGSECKGLSITAEQACDWRFKIPMFGMTESYNLSVAAAISLYETTGRKRLLLNQCGDLDAQEWRYLQACYYLNSVNPRLVNALFHEKTQND